MTEKKGRGPRPSDCPAGGVGGELKQKRDAFLHTFFKRGAELTEELVGNNTRLRDQLASLEEENAALKTQLASDKAIRDLLKKISELEREKEKLLSAVHEHTVITNRFVEIESELESFANLYVASFQLHSSLRVASVIRHIRELLVQLVGVRSLGIYFVDDDEQHLVPIAADGIDVGSLPKIPLRDSAASNALEALVERTYLTGVPHIADGELPSTPVACLPLALDNRTVGVIVVYALLEHKKRLVTVDRELFKLLEAHAGSALVSAHFWSHANGALPSAEELREMSA